MKYFTQPLQILSAIIISFIVTSCSSSNDIIVHPVNINPENLTDKTDKNYDQDRSGETNLITDTYRYQLPVIFHIFCMQGSDTKDILTPTRIKFILDNVNDLWKGKYNSYDHHSQDINVDFVLATDATEKDESGKTVYVRLKNPGIDYVDWTGDSIDVEDFMNSRSNNTAYMEHLWDPNHYINIMVFPFKNTSKDGSTTLGITDLPYTTSGDNQLSGLITVNYTSMNKSNLKFPYCSAINALYASSNYDSNRYTATNGKGSYFCNADVSATLAHELGHYLGLHHVFTEDAKGNIIDSCSDTDYCEDTPSYNRIDYVTWESHYRLTHQELYLDELDIRHNCSDSTFHASNFMDYYDCTNDLFTKDQRNRMRHVLYYSPLIPGPKKVSSRAIETRAEENQLLDLPVMIRK
ncbi:MAG: zinc-dependent metalloproteinase lipoprotein [Prevotella sp.]|jgi:zinc-dependent metalloproteinase lipoprotein|nr:zinc-dependent metalloproteinase lipoprotein [Prevotella sp.]